MMELISNQAGREILRGQVVLLLFTANASSVKGAVLVEELKRLLGRSPGSPVQVIQLDTSQHPEVTRSFQVQKTPTSVLLRNGKEILRIEESLDSNSIVQLIRQQLH